MRLKGGVSMVFRPPAFSTDGKLLLVCTGCTVSIFSVDTGLLVNELEGHTGLVTSISVVEYAGPTKSIINHVWTSSLDGTLRFWNFSTGSMLRMINVLKAVHSMVVPRHSESGWKSVHNHDICVLLVEHRKKTCTAENNNKSNISDKEEQYDNDEPGFRVVLHNLTTKKPLQGHLAKISSFEPLICSPLGGLVGIVDNHKLWVWRVSKEGILGLKSFQETRLHHTKRLKALAFDPTETLVAGGDSSGRLLIWKDVGEMTYALNVQHKGAGTEKQSKSQVHFDSNRGARGDDDAASLSTYHWHSDQINHLMFSLDGAYLFSGGREAVFVMWQVETGKKRFLPRLGSSVLHFAGSPDESLISVACADNLIKLINLGTMSVQKNIQGIKPHISLPKELQIADPKNAALQPGTRNLVLPAKDMSLQFYDLVRDRQSGEVHVSPYNYVSSKKRQEKIIDENQSTTLSVFITHIVFSRDASSMVTAECCKGEDNIGRGSYLKFWRKETDSAVSNFYLSTQIQDPHKLEISSLVFHPNVNICVSCCCSGEFKVWICDKGRKNAVCTWRCRSVGSYREKAMLCADFSTDGSLLAVSAQELITLWNPSSNGLVHVLGRSSLDAVKSLRFVPSTYYLVVVYGGESPVLTVWSLETLSILWSCNTAVEALAVDPNGPYFSISRAAKKKGKRKGSQGSITVFHADTPVPRAVWSVHSIKESKMLWLPSSVINEEATDDVEGQGLEKSYLAFVSRQREYVVFDPFAQQDPSKSASMKSFHKLEQKGLSTFASIYGNADAIDNTHPKPEAANVTSGGHLQKKFFDCPSHLISLESIGYSYIESLLK